VAKGPVTNCKEVGEEVALKVLPKKAEEVDEFIKEVFSKYETPTDAETVFSDRLMGQLKETKKIVKSSGNERKSKKRKVDEALEDSDDEEAGDGPRVPPNDEVISVARKVRDLLADAVDTLRILEMWIRLKIPKIEDGNNFGVEIQEDVFSQIQSSRTTLHRTMSTIHSSYLWSRAQAASKVSRFPTAEDFVQYIVQIDVFELFSLRISTLEVRDVYEATHDLVKKNLEKLKNPRSTDQSTSMY